MARKVGLYEADYKQAETINALIDEFDQVLAHPEGVLAEALADTGGAELVNFGTVGGVDDATGSDVATAVNALISKDVPNLKALGSITPAIVVKYDVAEMSTNTGVGGSGFKWDATAQHNGVTAFAPIAIQTWNGTKEDINTLINYVGAPVGAWVRTPIAGAAYAEVSVLFSGVVPSSGSFNNVALIQKTIDFIYSEYGKGTAFFPDTESEKFYSISSYLVMRPKVSLKGGPSKPLIKSSTIVGGGYGDILLPGNFHPDFSEDWTYHTITTPTSATKVIEVPTKGSMFAVGDQVFVASTKTNTAAGFNIPLYGWLNVVESVSGDNITLRYAIDVPIAMGVAILKNETARDGRVSFFWQDATISSLTIECAGGWTNDTATLNVEFSNLVVTTNRAIYGNTFQETVWKDSIYNFRTSLCEQSHNSLNTVCRNVKFNYIGSQQVTDSGVSIQENARNILFDGFEINAPTMTNGFLLRTINTQNVKFKNFRGFIGGNSGNSVIQIGDSSTTRIDSDFPIFGNYLDGFDIYCNNVGRFALLYAGTVTKDNGVKNGTFRGVATTDAARLEGVGTPTNAKLSIKNVHFEDGDIAFAGVTTFKYDLIGTYVPDGINGESNTDTAFINNGYFNGLTSDGSVTRSSFISRTFTISALNQTISNLSMGNTVLPYETYVFTATVRSQGNNKDRKLQVYLRDDTGGVDYLVAEFTVLAAAALKLCELTVTFKPQAGNFIVESQFKNLTDNTTTLAGFRNTTLSMAIPYKLRLDSVIGVGPGDEGNASWEVIQTKSWIDSMIYSY